MAFPQRASVQSCSQRGDLLPTDLLLQLLQRKIEAEKERGYRRFLIDGFPRKMEQGLEFEKKVENLLDGS